MMNLFLRWSIFATICAAVSGKVKKYNVNFAVTYSSEGAVAFISDTLTIGRYWKQTLEHKNRNDPNWPLNITVELYDVKSDVPRTVNYFLDRTNSSKKQPPLTAVLGPESFLGYISGSLLTPHKIPQLLAITNPNATYVVKNPSMQTSFLAEPAARYQLMNLIDTFVSQGVKTLVAFAMLEGPNSYNMDTCFGAADVAASRGIKTLAKLTLNSGVDGTSDLENVIRKIRDTYKPDAVIWCDWACCALDFAVIKYNPLPIFKKLNYLPKALSLLDCIDSANSHVQELYSQGLFDYVSAGQYVNAKLTGVEYTESATPFSSTFRAKTQVRTVTDALNVGLTDAFPSSTKLFFEWYYNITGGYPSYQTAFTWACFDLMEAAAYHGTQMPSITLDGVISAEEVYGLLLMSQASTPAGTIRFDENNVNTAAVSIMVQALPGHPFAEIVAPSTQKTSNLIFPMPTWDERIYTWTLWKGPEEMIAAAIAGSCTAILFIIMVTATWHNRDISIKMFHYFHINLMCLAAIAVCWGMVLVWQWDVKQYQCSSLKWIVYLPASFMIHLINIKAYRLSVFLQATMQDKRPKPFSHMRVLKLTFMLLMVTVVILLIEELADPLKRKAFFIDSYRPKYDVYECQPSKGIASPLQAILITIHVVASLGCIISVRNGMEAFKDGTVIKEAFILLYMFALIAYILQQLGLQVKTAYLLRTACVCIGVSFFCFRLMIGRCFKFWLPEAVQEKLEAWKKKYMDPLMEQFVAPDMRTTLAASSASIHTMEEEEEGPVYAVEAPTDGSLDDMVKVFNDPARLAVFAKIAKENFVSENVEFLVGVLEYKKHAVEEVVQSSNAANDTIRDIAVKLCRQHIGSTSAAEVNVCAKTCTAIESGLKGWKEGTPFLTKQAASEAVEGDKVRFGFFDVAFKEIAIMLYQNLWNKFRSHEAQVMAGGDA